MVGKICKIRAQSSLNAANAKKKVLGLKGFGVLQRWYYYPKLMHQKQSIQGNNDGWYRWWEKSGPDKEVNAALRWAQRERPLSSVLLSLGTTVFISSLALCHMRRQQNQIKPKQNKITTTKATRYQTVPTSWSCQAPRKYMKLKAPWK